MTMKLFFFYLGLLLFALNDHVTATKRNLTPLSSGELAALATTPDPSKNLDLTTTKSHLSQILIPRTPGTANNTFVQNYIKHALLSLKWHIEEDSFETNTIAGKKTFTNIIATKDPKAPMKVVMSAHFDSKWFPNFPESQFLGATDSAAPCAMLLDLAEALNPLLDKRAAVKKPKGEEDTTLQLIFFDGEEAFYDWTATDSIYGSRHLAEKWDSTYVSPHPKRRQSPTPTILSTIEHLILLDLLGAPNPSVQSFYLSTAWMFDGLISAERRLDEGGLLGALNSASAGKDKDGKTKRVKRKSFFKPRTAASLYGGIEDDHIPFVKRGVSILHVIPIPFPKVWHTLKDDASALDLPTMTKWNLIFRIFMAEYLGLKPDVDLKTKAKSEAKSEARHSSNDF